MPEFASNGLTLVSLFAGCGGSSLGYKTAGYEIKLAVEWDAGAAACYRLNFPETPVHEGDIASLGDAEALGLAGLGEGELDVLDGSPPCQGFSIAGKRRFSDGRNDLFREYVRLLECFKPKAFVMENVSGLRKGKMRLKFAEITLALKATGYRVSCRELNAWWYGVPQDRKRLLWVGVRGDLGGEPSHPAPVFKRPVSVAEALSFQTPAAIRRGFGGIKNDRYFNLFRSCGSPSPILEAAKPPIIAVETHPGYKDSFFRVGVSPTLGAGHKPRLARLRPAGIRQVREDYENISPGADVGKWQSKKLKGDRPSYTQVTSQPNWHPFEARSITVEEAKILQGFPGWFQVSEYRLIGNSVPPPMAEAVGRHVASLLTRGPA